MNDAGWDAYPVARPGKRAVVVRVGPRLPRVALSVAAAGLVVLASWITGYEYRPAGVLAAAPAAGVPGDPDSVAEALAAARSEHRRLRAALARKSPSEVYVVVDQTNNRLYLRRGDEVLLDAVCSAGSGMVLRERDGHRVWTFDTPRGAFRVQTKIRNPVWRKPDWAFVEEGLPIPEDPAERFEYGVLGEYGLYFGDGFLIHGTLYERLLGRSVTHGCIRVGRDDLRKVAASARVGTSIFIF